jgi:deoxycytidine triphosphate deaminase
MSRILKDTEISKLLGSVINPADRESLRPNAYVMRLGAEGEFLNAGKQFELGKKKKGVRIPPGHSVAVTAAETLDFRPETVDGIFPGCGLHGFISPTTDLSREGIVAPSTQVDAGYYGTLNWTLTNSSTVERRFTLHERLFRLTIFLLEKDEVPDKPYAGDYQDQHGYVRSRRRGPPVGMRDEEWEDPKMDDSPEALLETLIKSGYPWNALGQRLKIIDQQFKSVSDEYSAIQDSIDGITRDLSGVTESQRSATGALKESIRTVIREEAGALQNAWLVRSGAVAAVLVGLAISVLGNQVTLGFVSRYSAWIGPIVLVVGIVLFLIKGR